MEQNFVISEGLRIDLEEGWKKIISRQFGGDPGKGFGELIQNFLDSYGSDIPWKERRGIITFGDGWISIKDFGSGLNLEKIKLVTSMGGTDKSSDPNKIGKFGIGFFSIFNPKLRTRKVEITTMCEGEPIKLEYIITKDGTRPLLNSDVLDHPIDFSTEVKVYFDNPGSVYRCIEYGKGSLRYYPCNIKINGGRYHSVWDEAQLSNAYFFEKKYCNGFFKKGNSYRSVTVLCKYEYITEMPIRYLVTGGHGVHHNLDDYASTETPFLPELEMVLNCNNLSVTISRDSYYLDYNFRNLISDLNDSLLDLMHNQYRDLSKEVTLANIYILRKKIRGYWNNRTEGAKDLSNSEAVFDRLITSKVFPINGKRTPYSLVEIKEMLSKDTPLYFSESKTNLRWLGGAFKHDFIVLPEKWKIDSGAPEFYETLFSALFDDVVNLDTINGDKNKMRSLIDRDIIRKESLEPSCTFIEPRVLSEKEALLLKKLERLLNRKDIVDTIERSINIPVHRIHPSFFLLKDGGMHISTGMFDEQHKPINEDFISNFVERKDGIGEEERLSKKNTILLGLCLNNPFVRKLIESDDPHSEYYALTYIAHELTTCQKLLSPYSSFFNMVKARLSSELRRCMIVELTGEQ